MKKRDGAGICVNKYCASIACNMRKYFVMYNYTETTRGIKMSHTPDELNADYILQAVATEMLLKVARGEIDLNELARREIANRGLSAKTGEWIGFKAAAEELKN